MHSLHPASAGFDEEANCTDETMPAVIMHAYDMRTRSRRSCLLVPPSPRLSDTTYAVGARGWCNRPRTPPFWPVTATDVAVTGQKGDFGGGCSAPNRHRV